MQQGNYIRQIVIRVASAAECVVRASQTALAVLGRGESCAGVVGYMAVFVEVVVCVYVYFDEGGHADCWVDGGWGWFGLVLFSSV